MLRRTCVVAWFLGFLACSGTSSGPEAAANVGANEPVDAAATSADGSIVATDSGLHDGPSDGGDAGDAGSDPMAPHPPSGATACGSGIFNASDAVMTCQSGWSIFGPGANVQNGCGSLTSTGGIWQAWCTPSETYFWARFDDVAMPSPLVGCSEWTLFPLYAVGSNGGTIGSNGPNGYATSPKNQDFLASGPSLGVAIWTTVAGKVTDATLFVAATQIGFSCKGPLGDYAMLGAPIALH